MKKSSQQARSRGIEFVRHGEYCACPKTAVEAMLQMVTDGPETLCVCARARACVRAYLCESVCAYEILCCTCIQETTTLLKF